MAHVRQTTPTGHGEVLTRPDYSQWAALARAFAVTAREWDFEIAGVPVRELRRSARREAVARAREFSERIGVAIRPVDDEPDLLIMTGHQPEFYHPGVWIKDFLLQRFSEDTGAAAIDMVVDSDGFETLEIHSPCLRPDVRVCRAFFALGTTDGCYACTPVPDPQDIKEFCRAGAEQLRTLPAPAIGRHFASFCDRLEAAAAGSGNVAELLTFARRNYEAAAGTDYLELPVTSMTRSRSFAALVAHLALDAVAFSTAYNGALRDFRDRTGTRNAAQPFPDLLLEGDAVELPLWLITGRRATVWARTGEAPALLVDGEVVCDLSGGPSAAIDRIVGLEATLAPKALALTTYARLLVADFFIHGVGGGRYDEVTEDVLRRYFGVEPPPFAVASMTMYLPLGAHVVEDEEIEAVAMALNRLQHNPDQMLTEIEFETAVEHETAAALADEKSTLVAAIRAQGADKKAIGARIREVNAELAALLGPFERELQDQLGQLKQQQQASEVLTDRTYPFCFWDPREIADKAR